MGSFFFLLPWVLPERDAEPAAHNLDCNLHVTTLSDMPCIADRLHVLYRPLPGSKQPVQVKWHSGAVTKSGL